MATYYIKYIWGPAGQMGYPDNDSKNNIIVFAEGGEKLCERFRECVGFLLYETSNRRKSPDGLEGAMTIYGWGVIDPNQKNLNITREEKYGKRWTTGVRVILKKRVDPKDGISLKKLKEITGVGNMQRRGGLLTITENQFKTLQEMLEAA